VNLSQLCPRLAGLTIQRRSHDSRGAIQQRGPLEASHNHPEPVPRPTDTGERLGETGGTRVTSTIISPGRLPSWLEL